VEVLAARA